MITNVLSYLGFSKMSKRNAAQMYVYVRVYFCVTCTCLNFVHDQVICMCYSMSCSMCISLEDLDRGEVSSQNEVWIKAGRLFAVPVNITKSNTVFGWEFTSYPKVKPAQSV